MQNSSWHAFRRTQRSINRSEDVFVRYPVHVICVDVAERCIFILVFLCFIVNCTKEDLESVFRLSVWLHKGLSNFNLGLVFFLTGTHDFSRDESPNSP